MKVYYSGAALKRDAIELVLGVLACGAMLGAMFFFGWSA